MGKVDPFYTDVDFHIDGNSNKVKKTANVINKNMILHITEVINPGEVISIELQSGLRLDKMRKGDEHGLQIYTTKNSLMYYITSGKQGAIEITSKVVDDTDNFFSKLKANLTDTELRDYFVKRTLADSKVVSDANEKIPEVMNITRAAEYLDVSVSWLEKKGGSGEIPRTRHKKYRKIDLDNWMNTK